MIRATVAETALDAVADDADTIAKMNATLEGSAEILQKTRKLVESVKELESELKESQFDYYRIIADLLVDCQEQISFFDAYLAVPHIILIRRKLTAIESELRRQVQWSIREIAPLINTDKEEDDGRDFSMDLSSISQMYLVVNALGVHFRKDLLGRFAQTQLMPYEKLFSSSIKYSNLESLDKRFAFLKRLLRASEKQFSSVFPSNWQLQRHFYAEFCRRTRKHIHDHLLATDRCNMDPHEYVPILLKALKNVISFEAEMKASFAVASRGQEESSEEEIVSVSIVEAFDKFLGPYVQLEREELERMMEKLMQNEDSGIADGENQNARPSDVCFSSQQMFEFIKKSLKRCTGYSTGVTYLSLSKEFRICLHNYSESLKFRCPSPVAAKQGRPAVYVLSPAAELKLCQIINTAEYCVETIPPLEAMMKKHIQPDFAHEVDFGNQVDSFVDVIAYTMNILTQSVATRVEPTLRSMRHTNWANVDTVGDDSPYVKEMIGILSEEAVRLRSGMSKFYFNNYCMKMVTLLLDHLQKSIWQLKRISKTGSGQLLLDLNGIKEYLLRMPNVRLASGEEPCVIPNTYNTVVTTSIKQVEVILKLVCTEDEMLNEMFALLWPDGKQSDLDAIIALKAKAGILDPVGDMLKDKIGNSAVGRGAQGAVNDMKFAGKTAVGGLKSALGDLMSGNIFADESGHGKPESTHGMDNSGSGTDRFKAAFGGINAAFGFKKAGATGTTPTNSGAAGSTTSTVTGSTQPKKAPSKF